HGSKVQPPTPARIWPARVTVIAPRRAAPSASVRAADVRPARFRRLEPFPIRLNQPDRARMALIKGLRAFSSQNRCPLLRNALQAKRRVSIHLETLGPRRQPLPVPCITERARGTRAAAPESCA